MALSATSRGDRVMSASGVKRSCRKHRLRSESAPKLPSVVYFFALRYCLFDHLVRASEQHRRRFAAERFCRLQVDEKLKPGRLRDRKIGRLRPAQNLVHELGGAPERVRKVDRAGPPSASRAGSVLEITATRSQAARDSKTTRQLLCDPVFDFGRVLVDARFRIGGAGGAHCSLDADELSSPASDSSSRTRGELPTARAVRERRRSGKELVAVFEDIHRIVCT